MIKVIATFEEPIFNKESMIEETSEIAAAYLAHSVQTQKDGIYVRQVLNGMNQGIFLKYSTLKSLSIDGVEIADLKDTDLIESTVKDVMDNFYMTFVGSEYLISLDGEEFISPEELDITENVRMNADVFLYFMPISGYVIRSIRISGANPYSTYYDNVAGVVPVNIYGISGNILVSVDVAVEEAEAEDATSAASSSVDSSED